MKSRIDDILKQIGLETPDLEPINKREAIQMGLVEGREKPKKGICGKSVYPSQAKCNQAINHLLKNGNSNTSFLRAYQCEECKGGWHMSSFNPNKRK
jgi:hypothetical protein